MKKYILSFLVIFISNYAEANFFEEGVRQGVRAVKQFQRIPRHFSRLGRDIPRPADLPYEHGRLSPQRPYLRVASGFEKKHHSYKNYTTFTALGLVSLGLGTVVLAEGAALDDDVEIGKSLFSEWYKQTGTSKKESAVVVIGNTKAGKSTMIASLVAHSRGETLEKTPEGEFKLRSHQQTPLFPVIGENFCPSKSEFPRFFNVDGTLFIDTPGLNDNRSGVYDIVRSATLETTVNSIKHPKFVIVVSYHELLATGGDGFIKLVTHFSPIFEPSVLDSVLWVITQVPPNRTSGSILAGLEKFKKSNESNLASKNLKVRVGSKFPGKPEAAEKRLVQEVDDLEATKEMLGSIHQKNLVIFDSGSNSELKEFKSKVSRCREATSPVFRSREDEHDKFKKFSDRVISSGLEGWGRVSLRVEERRDLEKDISLKKALRSSKSLDVLREKLAADIQRQEQILKELRAEKKKIMVERRTLEDNAEEKIIRKYVIEEKRRSLSWNKTRRSFDYDDSLVTKYERGIWNPDTKQYESGETAAGGGEWRRFDHVDDHEHGRSTYKIEYVGGSGKPADAYVHLFGKSNAQADVKDLIQLQLQRERELEQRIEQIQKKKQRSERDLKEPEKITESRLMKELETLLVQKDSLEKELKGAKEKIGELELYEAIQYLRRTLGIGRTSLDSELQRLIDQRVRS